MDGDDNFLKKNRIKIGAAIAAVIVIVILFQQSAAKAAREQARENGLTLQVTEQMEQFRQALSVMDVTKAASHLERAKELDSQRKVPDGIFENDEQRLADHTELLGLSESMAEYLDSPPASQKEFVQIQNAYDLLMKYHQSIDYPPVETLRLVRGASSLFQLNKKVGDRTVYYFSDGADPFNYIRQTAFVPFANGRDDGNDSPLVKNLVPRQAELYLTYLHDIAYKNNLLGENALTLGYPLADAMKWHTDYLRNQWDNPELDQAELPRLYALEQKMYGEIAKAMRDSAQRFTATKRDLDSYVFLPGEVEYVATFFKNMQSYRDQIAKTDSPIDPAFQLSLTSLEQVMPAYTSEMNRIKESNDRINRETNRRFFNRFYGQWRGPNGVAIYLDSNIYSFYKNGVLIMQEVIDLKREGDIVIATFRVQASYDIPNVELARFALSDDGENMVMTLGDNAGQIKLFR